MSFEELKRIYATAVPVLEAGMGKSPTGATIFRKPKQNSSLTVLPVQAAKVPCETS